MRPKLPSGLVKQRTTPKMAGSHGLHMADGDNSQDGHAHGSHVADDDDFQYGGVRDADDVTQDGGPRGSHTVNGGAPSAVRGSLLGLGADLALQTFW